MSEDLLSITNLHTYFETPEGIVKANSGVKLNIHPNETLGLVGESGCGKTVVALSILRLQQPGEIKEGSIQFNGKELTTLTEKEMQRIRGREIALIPQDPLTSLNPVFTVGEQIAEAIRVHHGEENILYELRRPFSFTHSNKIWKRAIQMMREVGIPLPDERVGEYPHQFSGGMRQRVLIAMALISKPNLLIADEPTTALDVTIQAQILDLMKDFKKSMAILLITHDLGVVSEICDRVAVMYAGKIVEIADVYTIFTDPLHPYTQGLLSSITTRFKRKTRLPCIEGVVPDLISFPDGCSFHPRCKNAKPICSVKEPDMIRRGNNHYVKCHILT